MSSGAVRISVRSSAIRSRTADGSAYTSCSVRGSKLDSNASLIGVIFADLRPRREPGLRGTAPEVADRQGERVGGVGRARRLGQPSSRVTIAPTWALSARPDPVTAALTSLGRVQRDGHAGPGRGQDRQPGHLRGAHDGAHVVLAEHPLDRDDVRARARRSRRRTRRRWATRRAPIAASAGVRTTSTCTRLSGRPGAPSTTPRPHRVSPGSTPSTRTGSLLGTSNGRSTALRRGAAGRHADTPRRAESRTVVRVRLRPRASGGAAPYGRARSSWRSSRWRSSAACWPGATTHAAHGSADFGVFLMVLGWLGGVAVPARVRATPTPRTGPVITASRRPAT